MATKTIGMSSWQATGLVCIRIIAGSLMVYHGWEIFSKAKMDEYLKWDVIKILPAPAFMLYLGKAVELMAGICLALGLFTRFAALGMAVIMLFICFKIGKGRFYFQDQHPFLFALLALVFFFMGPVKWSLDQLLFRKKIIHD